MLSAGSIALLSRIRECGSPARDNPEAPLLRGG
jgi:hypothetical protein